MIERRSCSWCDTLNATSVEFCATCGHSAQRPRQMCTCGACQRYGRPAVLPQPPLTIHAFEDVDDPDAQEANY